MNNNINETIHSFILSSEKDKEKPNILTTIESAYLRLLLFLQTKFTYGHSASDSYHFSNVIKEKVSLFLLIHSSEDKGTLPETIITVNGRDLHLWQFPFSRCSILKNLHSDSITCLVTDNKKYLFTGGLDKNVYLIEYSKNSKLKIKKPILLLSNFEAITSMVYFQRKTIDSKKKVEIKQRSLLIAAINRIDLYVSKDRKERNIMNQIMTFNIESKPTNLRSFLIIYNDSFFIFAANNYVRIKPLNKGIPSNGAIQIHGKKGEIMTSITSIIKLFTGIVVTCSNDKTIKFWTIGLDLAVINLATNEFKEGFSCVKEISKEKLLSGSINGRVALWSLKTYSLMKVYDVQLDFVFCIETMKVYDNKKT